MGILYYLCIRFLREQAELAQLVEQRIRNAWVGGSSPPFGSNKCKSPSSDGWEALFLYAIKVFLSAHHLAD